MATIKKYNGSTWENAVVRKYGTATETIQSGDILYASGQAISTYTIKGNTVQSGTPTPSNPVAVNGVGNATTNLFNAYNTWTKRTSADVVDVQDSGATISITTTLFCYTSVDVTANTDYVITCTSSGGIARNIAVYKSTSFTTENLIASLGATGGTFNSGSNTKLYVLFYASNNTQSATAIYSDVRLNTGNTAQPFEPYGFKIPILTTQGTAVNYLGSVQSTRQIYKYICTGNENWTTNFGVSLFMVQSIFNDNPFIPEMDSISTHYTYNPIQSGLAAGLAHGQYALQRAGAQAYNIGIKNTDYTDTTKFKAYLQQQYAAGTPVTIYYVLASPTTGIVNEPLQKIGDYSDSISNAAAIPTTDGANSISVDTTVQPSEFSATYTGWHDSSVKEWDGTNWQ